MVLYVYAAGKNRINGTSVHDNARPLTALEMVAPNLPGQSFAARDLARETFGRGVLAFLLDEGYHNNLFEYPKTTEEQFRADHIEDNMIVIIRRLPRNLDAYNIDTMIAHLHPAAENQMENLAIALTRFLAYVFNHHSTEFSRNLGAAVYTIAYVGLGKRGTVSQQKLLKICTEIRTDTGKNLAVTAAECDIFYKSMAGIVNADTAQAIMEGLSGHMQDFSLRLRLTVDQSIKGGMTCFWAIQEAMRTFRTFDWSEAMRYIGPDFQRYAAAVLLVGNNEYYGFGNNLGDAAATKYKSLAWLAMHLLVRHKGAEFGGLIHYATYGRAPDHEVALTALIDNYRPGVDPLNVAACEALMNRMMIMPQNNANQ